MKELQSGEIGEARRLGKVIERGKIVVPEIVDSQSKEVLLPVSQWMQSTEWTAIGFVNLTPDTDMFVRRQQLRTNDKDGYAQSSFALSVYATARERPNWAESETLSLDSRLIPLDNESQLLINYRGPAGTFERRPFHEVLAESRGRDL